MVHEIVERNLGAESLAFIGIRRTVMDETKDYDRPRRVQRATMRKLRQHGFRVQEVPANARASDVLSYRTECVFLSDGPSDPEALDYAHSAVDGLMTEVSISVICLRHQIPVTSSVRKPYRGRMMRCLM
jgi:hypothetical protein